MSGALPTNPRRPCWCHHCGFYSFRDEWATSGLGIDNDTCPECGDAFPPMAGPLGEDWDAATAAAYERREVWA